jgi:hypothetical protein
MTGDMNRGGRNAPVALGFRVKSGRAIAVAMSGSTAAPAVVLCREVALGDPRVAATRQPYHAAFGTARDDLEEIARLTAIIEQCAAASIAALLDTDGIAGHGCAAAALVVGSLIDPATVGNRHIRAHASEGRLFRLVLERALESYGVRCTTIVEKQLPEHAAHTLRRSEAAIRRLVGGLGRAVGGPWRAEQKAAATGAWMML